MRVIVERMNGRTYVYRETEKQFKINQKKRKSSGSYQVFLTEFDDNCLLDDYGYNCHTVITLTKTDVKV